MEAGLVADRLGGRARAPGCGLPLPGIATAHARRSVRAGDRRCRRWRPSSERYPDVPIIIELESELPGDGTEVARRTVDVVRQADAVGRVALGSFSGRALRTVRLLEPALRTGAAREETRWALYRSWVGWPLGRPRYQEFQVPERVGRDDGRHPAVRRARPQVRPRREGLDRGRGVGHDAAPRLGRRRDHQRQARRRCRRLSTRERRGGRELRLDVHGHAGQPVEHLLHFRPARRRASRSWLWPSRSCPLPGAS